MGDFHSKGNPIHYELKIAYKDALLNIGALEQGASLSNKANCQGRKPKAIQFQFTQRLPSKGQGLKI